jgi:Fe-Mn family superoxide dismutase
MISSPSLDAGDPLAQRRQEEETMAKYTLPDLPYDYAALEPHISGKIMQLHHDKHHQAYVTGANTALEQLAEARETGNLANVNKLEKDLAFNLGGHVNHSIFWTNLSPDGGGQPEGELAAAIDEFFGGFDKFQAHFTAAATGIQGSGWAVLSWDPIGEQLIIQQLFDQQSNTAMGTIPVFQLDMWEHAFYLDYLNVKADYVKAVWNIANWQNVQERFAAAREKATGLLVLS